MKKAYTLVELIFVIVIIGVLAGVAGSSFKSDYLAADMDYIAAKIKEAQYKGIGYEHRNFDGTFQSGMKGCIELTETALEDKASEGDVAYKLHVSIDTSLSSDMLCFDAKGRPHETDFSLGTLLNVKKEINLSYNGRTKQIIILPLSGFAIIGCN